MSTVVSGLWHFSYTVRDLDRSIDFYCRLIGMELIHRQRQSNPYTARLVAYEDADLDVAMLRIPNCPVDVSGHHLELVQYHHPAGAPIDTATNRPGVAHLAFAVDDIHAMYDRLAAEGVRFKSAPVPIEGGPQPGRLRRLLQRLRRHSAGAAAAAAQSGVRSPRGCGPPC